METDEGNLDEGRSLTTGEAPTNSIINTTRTSAQSSRSSSTNGPTRHSSLRPCGSEPSHDFYEVAGSTIVVSLLILSPPIVLIGVILLTTGAIIGKMFVLVAGLATILSGVLVAAITAFVFVRMRGGARRQSSLNAATSQRHGQTAQARCGVGGGGSARGNYYRVTMDLERSTNSADGSIRVEITEQPTTMVTFFSTDSDIQSIRCNKMDGSDSNGSVSSANGTIRAIGIKRVAENTNPA